jgi:hypothetical protein
MKQLITFLFFFATQLHAQALTDTLITWQGGGFKKSSCRIQIYPADVRETRGKEKVVIIHEIAENKGATSFEDAKVVVETLETQMGINPETTLFIHFLSGTSFEGSNDNKMLLFKTTYNRQENGRLSAPNWKLVSAAEVLEFTDRRFSLR